MLVGDALGVPYEFHPAVEIPPAEQIAYVPPAGFRRAHRGTPPGTWSDDGAQAMCLLSSLLYCNGLDPADLGRRFVNWRQYGYMAVDSRVFDIGIQTSSAIRRLASQEAPLRCGPRAEMDNGNGSLMRVLPLALWHQGDDAELIRLAHDQSRLTHGHPRSLACCALYCLVARRMLAGSTTPWEDATATLIEAYAEDPVMFTELTEQVLPDVEPKGTGYVLNTLHSAKWCMKQPDFESAVKAAIQLGNDTDTTACVVGGLAGIRHGIEGIPRRWREGLRGGELLSLPLRELLERG